jgi:hypothetical protein
VDSIHTTLTRLKHALGTAIHFDCVYSATAPKSSMLLEDIQSLQVVPPRLSCFLRISIFLHFNRLYTPTTKQKSAGAFFLVHFMLLSALVTWHISIFLT